MQRVFEKILVAVDGSPQSNTAIAMAVFLAKRLESQVAIIHVVSREIVLPDFHNMPREGDNYTPINTSTIQISRFVKLPTAREYVLPETVVNEVTTWLHGKGKSSVSRAASAFRAEDIAVEEKLVEAADPAEKIIEEAETGNYRLIVMGNSGGEENEGSSDLHLGSVAKAVSIGAKTPVLIVRQRSQVKSILVPVDGSPKTEEILAYTAELAKKLNAKVDLLHVQESSILNFRPDLKDLGIQILEHAGTAIEGTETTKKLKAGDPAKMIIQTSIEEKSDLIIMGRGRHGVLRNFMLGKVSDHVVHHATVPVLLID
jgi:nucleotide-binding universal stress UspA family protein